MNHSQLQRRLHIASAAFLFVFSLILTLSPSVRERTWLVDYRWAHWIGYAAWLALTIAASRVTSRWFPETDPYLLPVASLLSGWGLLTIWRLDPYFGARQTIWLAIALAAFLLALRYPAALSSLRRYKYLALLGGILLTALTLVFGSNPSGAGPRLWIGGEDVYLQPSEPLKLLLVIYLAAYLASRLPVETFNTLRTKSIRQFVSIPLIVPTAIMTGLSLLILVVQRDLGTASIFLLIYTIILFLATGKRRVLLVTFAGLGLAALVGYFFVDIIHARLDAWLNPWSDPSGRSYQIIQSLLAIANGGTVGRGVGLGSPTLVPVAISDFIYTAIVEETGLLGAIGLLVLFGLLLTHGLRAALNAPDRFQRLLAGGLVAYLGVQSLLILGGNLRLLPLTGVTLPFVSYGGSSLVTSFLALAILLRVASQPEEEPAPIATPRPFALLAALFSLGLFASALSTGWWAVVRGPDLLTRTDNARRSIADRYVRRGSLLDRGNQPITVTTQTDAIFHRDYLYTELAPITGYTNPIFGQAGLEATLDGYLRGFQGNPSRLVWWHHLLYGTPPPGLDVRLSIDLDLQKKADELLANHAGAIVLLNAQSGEILAMASHPTYDPNSLDETGDQLRIDPDAPLVNRAAQGSYPSASLLDPLLAARFGQDSPPDADMIREFYNLLGLYVAPDLRLPVGTPSVFGEIDNLHVSPLQAILAFAPLSNGGILPAPRIALAVDTPSQGWVILPANSDPLNVMEEASARQAAESLQSADQPYWQYGAQVSEKGKSFAWFVAGTLPNWQGTPLTLVILLEENNTPLANSLGEALLNEALKP
ncbi:MAG: FtsW/RodA/SpoVE family cell cycle protein [Chloroflexota bacterium]